ncbi:MAG: response regulator transcription factor [Gemmatimonadetes bacterium]|nr:response regulator transcription factor [Gemmatimonadota bacterium]MYA10608.1 response regulator transcription factor [Gemmatimonadota bacterium]MYE71522.1 response regulator transcription factor [Gemmatimonadota bacterium]MYJ67962.1 response regulator transcription factor [Gemmatimonadota bacterium]
MSSDRPARAARVLVVEDEAEIAALVAYQLTREGYRVETVANGTAALDALRREKPDLLVLDRMLPEVSGDEVLQAIRSDPATLTLPVLVLTAKREQQDRIAGLELGADDYLTKPFSPRELVLRADAILRRAQGERKPVAGGGRILRAGALRVDVAAHIVTLDGEELNLTPTEFRLLRTLLERRGRTQTRRQLLTEAWQIESRMANRLRTRTVDMHVRRLRGKMGAAGEWIETVRGFGYRFQESAEVPPP